MSKETSSIICNKGKTKVAYTIKVFQTIDPKESGTKVPVLTEKAFMKFIKEALKASKIPVDISIGFNREYVYKDGERVYFNGSGEEV